MLWFDADLLRSRDLGVGGESAFVQIIALKVVYWNEKSESRT